MFKALGLHRITPRAYRHRAAFVLLGIFAWAAVARAQLPATDPAPQPAPSTAPAPQSPPSAAADQPPAPTAQTPPAPQAEPPQAPASPAGSDAAQPLGQLKSESGMETGNEKAQPGSVSEEELKQQLVGKQFYLRGGYLGDTLAYDEHGKIIGHSPQSSYTLSVIQVDHVRLTKHKVDLEGTRFGLHFNEQLAYEDPSSAYDKVRITPKKKVVKISIDREMVVNPKKKKESSKEKEKEKAKGEKATPAIAQASVAPPGTPTPQSPLAAESASPAAPATTSAADAAEPSEAEQLKASIAATPAAERPADPTSVTTTTSQSHANALLHAAIDSVLAAGLDDRMMAAMPDFWKLYYKSVAAKSDYRPADPSVLRQNNVDQKARLLTSFEPDSNDFAQNAGVAGMALYHAVIGPDGKPGEIAVGRPIGFGLDENAVAAIRKAKFSPAMKNGQPVPVMLDLVVQFRIFSKRTGATGALPDLAQQAAPPAAHPEQTAADKPADAPVLPGPYSVPHQ